MVSDFDAMLEKRKSEMSKRRRKKKDIDILNDNDDMISDMIRRMKEAAEVSTETLSGTMCITYRSAHLR